MGRERRLETGPKADVGLGAGRRDDLADFADRPVAEIVARICRDLGVAPPPSFWDDADLDVPQVEIAPTPGDRRGDADPGWTRAEEVCSGPVTGAAPGPTRPP